MPMVKPPAPGSIAEWLDAHEHFTVYAAAGYVIDRWPEVLEPLSYLEPGFGLTRCALERLIATRRQCRRGGLEAGLKTLDHLPGEGDMVEVKRKAQRRRRTCTYCDNPAHYRHTFLLCNALKNPLSAAYGKHPYEVTYCADADRFVCREHGHNIEPPMNMQFFHTFPAIEANTAMFLFDYESPATPAPPSSKEA